MTLSGVYVEHSLEHAACQLRAVILSFNKWRAARPSSLFAFAVTGEWQLYGTSMFISLLSPFLKPVLMLYLYSHHNGTAVVLSNLGPLLSMCGAAYWSSGAIIPTVCLTDVRGENKAPPEHLRTVWTYEPERTDVLTAGPVFIFSYSSKDIYKEIIYIQNCITNQMWYHWWTELLCKLYQSLLQGLEWQCPQVEWIRKIFTGSWINDIKYSSSTWSLNCFSDTLKEKFTKKWKESHYHIWRWRSQPTVHSLCLASFITKRYLSHMLRGPLNPPPPSIKALQKSTKDLFPGKEKISTTHRVASISPPASPIICIMRSDYYVDRIALMRMLINARCKCKGLWSDVITQITRQDADHVPTEVQT